MKIIFNSLVKQPNSDDVTVETEVDAEYELYNDNFGAKTKSFTFKESDTKVVTRIEFTNSTLNIFRDAVTLVFRLNEKSYDSSVYSENGQLLPLISVLDEIDFKKNKASYRLFLQDFNNNEVLLSNCFIELKEK